MLMLTPSAVEVVNSMATLYGEEPTAGLRIANAGGAPEPQSLEIEFVAGPDAQDEVLTQDGARVFLEPAAAGYLTDKVLTGELDDEGHVRFGLARQEGAGS